MAMETWALITGASRGTGKAIALSLAQDSHHIVIGYRSNTEAAGEVLAQIQEAGGSAELCPFDVSDPSACETAILPLIERLGAPYILVNNAGILRDGLLVWMEQKDWDEVITTNLGSFFHVTRPVIKSMLLARKGRIINLASTAGEIGSPGQVNYSAAKAGLIGATRSLACEVAKRGITVNAVAPGFIETEMMEGLAIDEIRSRIPLRRLGTPAEVAAAVSFLAGQDAGYITGHVLDVNGGLI